MTFSPAIIPGFNPDPSICRMDSDFYLVTSFFEYFPAHHSFTAATWFDWFEIC